MAAILSSAIMDSPIFHNDQLHSFILTQLDDGSHLGFSHLDFPLKSLTLTKIGHHLHKKNFTDSFWLILVMAVILNLTIIDSSILVCTLKLTHTCQDWFPVFVYAQKKLHSFILTHIGDGRHLEFCHVGFRFCHLGFRHLVFFSQIHSKTLSLHSDSDSN